MWSTGFTGGFFLGNSSFSNLRSTLYWTLVCWCCFETL